MDVAQTTWASSARPFWRTGLSRAFSWAIAFHVVAVLGLVGMIEYWPVTPPRPGPMNLDLEVMAASPATLAPSVETPAWAHAVAAVTPEFRAPPATPPLVPDAFPVAVSSSVVAPVVETSERPQAPDLAREKSRELASLPLWLPSQASAVSNSVPGTRVSGQGDGGGHPMALAEIRPYYPYAARTRGQEGKVMVRLRVTSGGEVDSAEIGRSSGFPVLDQSAVATARKARFKPAEHNGRPIPADMDLQFDFRLEN